MLTDAALGALKERVGDARYRGTFDCGYPVYECDLELRMLALEKLSAIEEYVLRVLDLDGYSLSGIDLVLGLGLPATRRAVAALLAADLLEEFAFPGDVSRYQLSGLGREALERTAVRKTLVVPFACVVDGFTQDVSIKASRARHLTADQLAELGTLMITPPHDAPTVDAFDLGRLSALLRGAARTDPDRWPQGEVLDLQRVVRTQRRYRRLDVVVFERTGSEAGWIVRVFERHGHQPALDPVFAELLRADPHALPLGDGDDDDPAGENGSAEAPDFILGDLWRQANANARRALELDAQVAEAEAAVESAGKPEASGGVSTREHLADLEAKHARLRDEHQKLGDQMVQGVSLVATAGHRPLLERAFTHAKEQVIIVSPWLSRDAIIGDLERWVAEAVGRGVRVRIGWGFSDAERDLAKEEASRGLADHLTEYVDRRSNGRGGAGGLEIVRLGDTHEKVLIADSNFCVVSSFNWLSFRPNPRQAMRRETGVRIGIPAHVAAMRTHYEEALAEARGRG